eukprot:267744-Rhodomonas_salina.3
MGRTRKRGECVKKGGTQSRAATDEGMRVKEQGHTGRRRHSIAGSSGSSCTRAQPWLVLARLNCERSSLQASTLKGGVGITKHRIRSGRVRQNTEIRSVRGPRGGGAERGTRGADSAATRPKTRAPFLTLLLLFPRLGQPRAEGSGRARWGERQK